MATHGITHGRTHGMTHGIDHGVVVVPSLSVVLADSADPVSCGGAYSYTVDLTVADADADNVSVAVTLPTGSSYVSSSGSGWTTDHAGGVVTCTRATAAVGAAPQITINVTARTSAATSSCTVTADADGAVQATDSENTVISAPGLALVLADSADPVAASASFNLTADLTVSTIAANNVSVAVTVAASLTIGSPSGTGWSFSPVGQVVTCTRATAAVGAVSTITIPVTAGASTVLASSSATADATGATQATDNETTQVAAAPTYVTSGTLVSGIGDVTPNMPAHQAGDILVLHAGSPNQAIALGTPGLFTEATDSPQGVGTAPGVNDESARIGVFWARAVDGSTAAPVITDPGNNCGAVISVFRGCVGTGNPWDVTAGGTEATIDTSVAIPGATTTRIQTLVVAACVCADENIGGNFASFANGDLTGVAERVDAQWADGNDGGLGVATGVKATAGAFGDTTATLTVAGAKAMHVMALRSY